MLFKRLLLKIETGQVLTKKQEKSLINKLHLTRPFSRSLLYVVIFSISLVFLVIGFTGGQAPLTSWVAYLIFALLVLLLVYLVFIPKHLNIKKYFNAVEKFYEIKFKNYSNYDILYIGQHVNPHIKPLRSQKIYLLTDGFHYLFVNDYFTNTEYLLPKYLTNGNKAYLRILNEKITDNYRMMVRLPDIEHFYVVKQEKNSSEEVKECDASYYKFFLDQTTKMDEDYVVLKMKGGIIFRLSYDVYDLFMEHMPLKEIKL